MRSLTDESADVDIVIDLPLNFTVKLISAPASIDPIGLIVLTERAPSTPRLCPAYRTDRSERVGTMGAPGVWDMAVEMQ